VAVLETELDTAAVPVVVAAFAVSVPVSTAAPIVPAAMSPAIPPQRAALPRVVVLVIEALLRRGRPGGALPK
jgi:hypothetical protein